MASIRHPLTKDQTMRTRFVFKDTIRQAPEITHHGTYMTLPGLHLSEDSGRVVMFNHDPLLLTRMSALSAELMAHLDHVLIDDSFVCEGVLSQGLYEVTIDGVTAKAELSCRWVEDAPTQFRTLSPAPLFKTKDGFAEQREILMEEYAERPWRRLEYSLNIVSPSLQLALGLYDQVRQGKVAPTRNWDGAR